MELWINGIMGKKVFILFCAVMPLCFSAFFFLSCSSLKTPQELTESTASWQMFGKNCEHSSMSDIASTELKEIWEYDIGAGFGGFSPTVIEGIVFVATLKGEIYSLNLQNGDNDGSESFGGAIFSGPIIYDSLMIVVSSQSKNNSFAYQLITGKMIWMKNIGDVEAAPTLDRNALYVASVNGDLYKIDPVTGKEIFRKRFPAPIRVSPIVDDTMVVFGCDDGNIYAIGSNNGNEIWKYDAGTPVWCTASVSDLLPGGLRIFVGTNGGKLLALTEGGTLKFDFATGEKILSMPISDDKQIYLGCNDGNFYAINADNGALIWKIQTDAPIIASAAQTKNQIILGSFDGNLYVIDKSDGKVAQKIKLSGRVRTQPAIWKNYLVVGAEDSEIFGFEIK